MTLAIISHTEHYKTSEGIVVGWSPTVNEINHLLHIFDEIYHVAMLKEGAPPPSVMAYASSKIKFIALPALGGKTISSKLKTIYNAPRVMSIVSKTLKQVDCFQLRTPTGIGVFLIPYLSLFTRKKGWFKYAGNWNQSNAPLGYKIQRKLLKMQNRPVTINGRWEGQPNHCVTFENPCLTDLELNLGKDISNSKLVSKKVTFCYVGRLEKQKGVERILKSFSELNPEERTRISCLHLVGHGEDLEYFKVLASKCSVDVIFHGFLPREKVHEIYKISHAFIMPTTASEGFPKVIAEAMNYGCMPIVSDISAISLYVKNNVTGFLIYPVNISTTLSAIKSFLQLDDETYFNMQNKQREETKKFTFSSYNNKIKSEILN